MRRLLRAVGGSDKSASSAGDEAKMTQQQHSSTRMTARDVDVLLREESQLQEVAGMFAVRLERDFADYKDVTAPLLLGLYELRRGVRIVAFHAENAPKASAVLGEIATVRGLLRMPYRYDLDGSEQALVSEAAGLLQQQEGREEGNQKWMMQVTRCLLHVACVWVAQRGWWTAGGVGALEMVGAGFARAWAEKREEERRRKEEEEATFKVSSVLGVLPLGLGILPLGWGVLRLGLGVCHGGAGV